VRTQDNVIRREVSVVEGDRFSASKLRKAKNKLQGLNYFETIDVTTPPAGDSELVDVKIKVSEKPTGTFTLGAGYSSQESVLGMASISQNNFLGKGQRMVFSIAHSGVRDEYNISFTEPYFMDKKLSAGFDLFRRETDQTRYSSVLEKATGGAVSLGFPISEHLTDTITYKLVQTEVHYTGTDPTQASQIIREQEKLSPYLESIIGNTLHWDYLDNRMTPSDGRSHSLITEVAGAGGDVRFARLVTDHHLYVPIDSDKEWVGHLRARLGYEDGLGNQLPIFERFFLGGSNSLRGFMPSGIGPRTAQSDAYGGSHFEQLNSELFFPMLGMSDKGVKGLVFMDAGFLGDKDLPTGVSDAGGIRLSSGVGVHWNSPFGPLRFTLGTPLIKDPNDKTRVFDFSIGSMM
jgi:outer membrane protein insertion porin family